MEEIKEAIIEEAEVSEADKAREILAKEEQENQQKCVEEVNAVLAKHGYALDVKFQIVIKK